MIIMKSGLVIMTIQLIGMLQKKNALRIVNHQKKIVMDLMIIIVKKMMNVVMANGVIMVNV